MGMCEEGRAGAQCTVEAAARRWGPHSGQRFAIHAMQHKQAQQAQQARQAQQAQQAQRAQQRTLFFFSSPPITRSTAASKSAMPTCRGGEVGRKGWRGGLTWRGRHVPGSSWSPNPCWAAQPCCCVPSAQQRLFSSIATGRQCGHSHLAPASACWHQPRPPAHPPHPCCRGPQSALPRL